MRYETNKIKLKDVADVVLGYPFRTAIKSCGDGGTLAVQIKNTNAETNSIIWDSVLSTRLSGKKKPDWLKSGDVLFAARGNRNFAVFVDEPPAESVCSPHFFMIRTTNKQVMPEFLAWFINQPYAQRYFDQSAQGSFIKNISRKTIEGLPIVLPTLKEQKIIVDLHMAIQREKDILQKIVDNRSMELQGIVTKILKGEK